MKKRRRKRKKNKTKWNGFCGGSIPPPLQIIKKLISLKKFKDKL
jgi:hypothetical protein